MVRFLAGLVFGIAFCGTVLWALAVLNPVGPGGQSVSPVQIERPEAQDAPEAQAQPAQGTAAAPEPDSAPVVGSVPETGAETTTPPAAGEGTTATDGGDGSASAQPSEPPEQATADGDPAAPQVSDESAPMTAMPEGDGGAPVTGDAGPQAFTGAPVVGGGAAMNAPALGGDDSANVAASGSDRPIRIAAAPEQVSAGSADTGAKPAVNTESAAVPEIGGSELEEEDAPLGAPPPLQAGAALADNAAAFSGNAGRPLMAIILIDTGENPELRAGLTALTAPITFGVQADIRNAEEISREYRSPGFEVTAVLPGSGRLGIDEDMPEDQVEPLLARVFERIPVAATVLAPIDDPLPQDRRMADAILDALAVTGHGLLTHRGNGLNNVPIIAGERGVPSGLVYRVIDDVPSQANISLALERAVLDASRSGHVIVMGRVREETVDTLFSWLLGSGAREVTIAPASAVLRNIDS